MPRVLDKQRSVASIPEISFISVVENGQKFAYGKRSTQLYFFSGFTKEHYHYQLLRVVQYTRTVTVRINHVSIRTDRTDRQQGYTVCKEGFTVRKSHLITGT